MEYLSEQGPSLIISPKESLSAGDDIKWYTSYLEDAKGRHPVKSGKKTPVREKPDIELLL